MTKRRLSAEQRAKVFKALSDPRRVDIVDALAKNGSLCGTDLANQLGISLALLCHHWEVLVEAEILTKERVGQLRICSLDADRLREATGGWDEALKGKVTALESQAEQAVPAKAKIGVRPKKTAAKKTRR